MSQISMHAPIGDLTISAEDNIIVSLDWGWAQEQNTNTLLQDAKSQLDDYFDGLRKNFDLPLEPPGTKFQQRVWSMMEQIPYGKTITYGEIAKALG
ncbi:MAG: Methylated-DNA--protein-cysteine methyltransferase, constitutive, partial [Alphaproteobacteria bacterium MarineAlpha1_Bin1]